MSTSESVRFAIDTGGTFTDIVVLNETTGSFVMDKSATTPQDTLQGVLAAMDKVKVDLRTVNRFFVHGSTTALNALLERKGVKTAYVTTRGFRDVPQIMRYNRPEMYNPKYRKPAPIVPRELRYEVTERMDAKGNVLVPLDEADVVQAAIQAQREGVKAIAVCLLHSYRNAAHEKRVREILQKHYPEAAVSLSSEVVSEHREFERSMTTILNGYLAPVVDRWIGNLQRELTRRGFAGEVVLTKSDGGGMTADAARGSPINMLLSGPAGGVIGGLYIANVTERQDLITMDVGGTSFDIAMIRKGVASTGQETKVNNYPILISNLDIRTIGAGGGSLAWVDSANALHVGPQSAGAQPGPICYGRGGTQPTVTDAFLVNRFINEKNFLGGEMSLDVEGARRGIRAHVAEPFGMELLQASSGILRIVMSNMAEAVKDIASETGEDPRDYGMLCFGGGGPMFGAYLIDELCMPTAIIPILPSAFSAWGMLMVDLRHDVAQTIALKLEKLSMQELASGFAQLETRGNLLLEKESVLPEAREFYRTADMRYSGQEHAVSVSLDLDLHSAGAKELLIAAFQATYQSVYGYTLKTPVDVVNIRVKAIGRIPAPTLREIQKGDGDPRAAFKGKRAAHDFLDVKALDFSLYDRARLRARDVIQGPAFIEEATTTTVVREAQICVVDRLGNLAISRK
ncbi:MAG: hydantoinase/oxoprolinase family protein [Gammaproteobacteria bacterium]